VLPLLPVQQQGSKLVASLQYSSTGPRRLAGALLVLLPLALTQLTALQHSATAAQQARLSSPPLYPSRGQQQLLLRRASLGLSALASQLALLPVLTALSQHRQLQAAQPAAVCWGVQQQR
jgi:hypothetical protein